MSRIKKSSVQAALDEAALHVTEAAGGDGYIRPDDMEHKLRTLGGTEWALTKAFYDDLVHGLQGKVVTSSDVACALAKAKQDVAERDRNDNGLSLEEIRGMSSVERLAVDLVRERDETARYRPSLEEIQAHEPVALDLIVNFCMDLLVEFYDFASLYYFSTDDNAIAGAARDTYRLLSGASLGPAAAPEGYQANTVLKVNPTSSLGGWPECLSGDVYLLFDEEAKLSNMLHADGKVVIDRNHLEHHIHTRGGVVPGLLEVRSVRNFGEPDNGVPGDVEAAFQGLASAFSVASTRAHSILFNSTLPKLSADRMYLEMSGGDDPPHSVKAVSRGELRATFADTFGEEAGRKIDAFVKLVSRGHNTSEARFFAGGYRDAAGSRWGWACIAFPSIREPGQAWDVEFSTEAGVMFRRRAPTPAVPRPRQRRESMRETSRDRNLSGRVAVDGSARILST